MEIKLEYIYKTKYNTEYLKSSLIDAVYELINGTYNNLETITISNPTQSLNVEDLSDFLTYILAYPIGVSTPRVKVRPFSVFSNMHLNGINGNFDNIVCFSGGIDSTAALLHLIETKKSIAALWCNYGQPYSKPEQEAVERISAKLSIPLYKATINLTELIALGVDKFKHIFPARNLLITAIAAALKPHDIILAGLYDELVVPDKSLRMYSEAPKYLGCNIYSPFIKMTKADVLSVWKKRWTNIVDVNETVSCYDQGGNCQNCSSCAKREVAKVASKYSNEFPTVFLKQEELIENHWFSRIENLPMRRRDDILIAFLLFKEKLSIRAREMINKYYEQYKEEVSERIKHLEELQDVE